MKQQSDSKLYWKDALRQVQTELDEEVAAAQNHRWSHAYHQAEADLTSPDAVVWLPDEIAEVIRQTNHRAPVPPATDAKRHHLTVLLVVVLLLIPAAISYLLAYRHILSHSH